MKYKPNYARDDTKIGRGLKKFHLSKKLIVEIKTRLKKNKTLRILEIGCGKGIVLLELLKIFGNKLELYGLNLNRYHGIKDKKDLIINAKDKDIILSDFDKRNLPKISFGNAIKLPYNENYFDIVISNVTFVHIKNKAKALENVYRVLKLRGIAFLQLDSYMTEYTFIGKIPGLYTRLNKKYQKNYLPRFMIGKECIPIKDFSKFFETQGIKIKVIRAPFKDKLKEGVGYAVIFWKSSDMLKFNLIYDKEKSERLTKFMRSKNPIVYGVIDVYKGKTNY